MSKRVERKVILFLVEGPNDEIALVQPFKGLLAHVGRVDSCPFYCDVTITHLFKGRDCVKSRSNVCETVRQFVLDYLESGRGYNWDDIALIVHVVDTDGAFVPDEHVVEDLSCQDIVYTEDEIRSADPEGVRRRNREKRKSIDALVDKRVLTWKRKHVPYHVFYCSRNFEHAFCGLEASLSDREKDAVAQAFRRRYENDSEAFAELLEQVGKGVPSEYGESWKFVKEGLRSLERHSNLVLLVSVAESAG